MTLLTSVPRNLRKRLKRLALKSSRAWGLRSSSDGAFAKAERHSRARFVDHFDQGMCERRPFYNFGAGAWSHPFFRNIDLVHPNYPNNRPDVPYDAFDLQPFPIETDVAKVFYFSHVNEHLPDEHNRFILSEVLRCLEPGGAVRIVYPDVDRAYDAYQRDDRDFFLVDWARRPAALEARKNVPTERLLLDFFATRAQANSPDDGNRKYSDEEFRRMLDELGLEAAAEAITSKMLQEVQRKRPNVHINWWNHGKFERILGELGFVDVVKSSYLCSRVPPLRDANYFDKVYPHMSGYVEARKPTA